MVSIIIDFERIEKPKIPSGATVTVTDMGHLQEVQYLEKQNTKATIKKIDKDTFAVVSTGEVKAFEHIENRKGSFNSLRQTFKHLRYLINANFKGQPNELHIVLTYAENMTDTKRLYKDFERFIKRFKWAYKGKTDIDYINVVEPQGRGAWHCHLLVRFNNLDSIYIDNKTLANMWGNGFVTIRSLKGVDNIGAYLSAYLSDLDVTVDESGIVSLSEETYKYMLSGGKLGDMVDKVTVDENGQAISKKVIKGGRLHLYPPGMNIYRKSKGIVEPTRQMMCYDDFVKKIVQTATPHYVSGLSLTDEENDYKNKIIYEQYNLLRDKKQAPM